MMRIQGSLRTLCVLAVTGWVSVASAQDLEAVIGPLVRGEAVSVASDRNADAIVDAADLVTTDGIGAEVIAVLDSIDAYLAGLSDDLTDDQRASLLAEWLRTQGVLAGATSTATGSVWAHTSDGIVLAYDLQGTLNRGVSGAAFTGTPRAPGLPLAKSSISVTKAPEFTYPLHELPASRKAIVLQGIGTGFPSFEQTMPEVQRLLQESGYELVPGFIATIDRFRAAQDLGVFYFHGHGISAQLGEAPEGQWSLENIAYDALVTGEEVTEAGVDRNAGLFRSGRLVAANVVVAYTEDGEPIRDWHYAVTTDFVRDTVSFDPNGLAIVSVANSMNTPYPALMQELGAVAVVGWDGGTNDDAEAAVAIFYLMVRLTGLDVLPGDGPVPYQPFDLRSVVYAALNDCEVTWPGGAEGFVGVQQTGSQLQISMAEGVRSLLLRPALRSIYPDTENGTMVLTGDFGYTFQDEEQVLLAGISTPIVRRDPFRIECTLPAGFSGDVEFLTGGRATNGLQLSLYRFGMTWVNRHKETNSIWASGSGQFSFRTSTLPHRLAPEYAPGYPIEWSEVFGSGDANNSDYQALLLSYSDAEFLNHTVNLEPDSTLSYLYNGVIPGGCPDIRVSGGGSLPHFFLNPLSPEPPTRGFAGLLAIFAEDVVDPKTRSLALTLVGAEGTQRSDCPESEPEEFVEFNGAPLVLQWRVSENLILEHEPREFEEVPGEPLGNAATTFVSGLVVEDPPVLSPEP